MRVAHFIHRYPPALGGSEAYFARLSQYLATAGDDVTVFTTTAVDLEAFWTTRGRTLRPGVTTEDDVEIRRYATWRLHGLRRALRLASLIPHPLWQLLTKTCNPLALSMWRDAGRTDTPFDLVHATAVPYGWVLACGLRLARRLRVPFVVTPFLHLGDPHDARDRTRRQYLAPAFAWLLRQADAIFVQTELERLAVLAQGVPETKVVLQGLGVEPAECTGGDRQRARTAWGVAADEVVVGHLANQSREKGTVDLLRAAERAWRQGTRFRVVLAGPEMSSFRAFWEAHRPSGKVLRLGVLTDEQKRDFFAGIDVFALPSRSDSFGLVLLEAWANGKPNIAYRAGGPAELIRDGEDGLLVPCGDLDGLGHAIRRLATDPAFRSRLGASGQRRTAEEFRWQDKLDLARDVCRELALPVHTSG